MNRSMEFNEDGVLSVDFLAGFTIFMIALIMVISLLPGILAGIESEAIDYDAVAYRTSVILVEDPGWPSNPPWNQMDEYHKADIERMGLSLSKDTPNILSQGKIDLFFNRNADFALDEDDYRSKVIFGDIPYLYNFSLRIDGEQPLFVGQEIPESSYGYQRRLVKVKEESFAHINFTDGSHPEYSSSRVVWNVTDPPHQADFAVEMDYGELYDRSISPAYRIDPRSEELGFDMENMLHSLDWNLFLNNGTMTLEKVRLYKVLDDGSSQPLPYNWNDWNNETYIFYYGNTPGSSEASVLNGSSFPKTIENETYIRMDLNPPLPFSDEMTSGLRVNFTFNYIWDGSSDPISGHRYLSGIHEYNYDSDNVVQPYLVDGVMEVAIW
ncbi:hypothetical protein AZH53_10865 [Methanomicrobiaceae archaeon CYW5]|uniref:hypothetical protein n=1 Tax=Methanovulcanius yangii TaxID=1789227 RepID=UPI0029CA5A51|nr:hypothetical protein [Methanovulcanius yangii]MBT8508905.1 hypothetical protein [Methanovulcanius yangii]